MNAVNRRLAELEQEAASHAVEEAALLKLVVDTPKNRQQNTSIQYSGKQEDFQSWCATNKYVDGDLVTERKLLTFLSSIYNRPIKKKGRQPSKKSPAKSPAGAEPTSENAPTETKRAPPACDHTLAAPKKKRRSSSVAAASAPKSTTALNGSILTSQSVHL